MKKGYLRLGGTEPPSLACLEQVLVHMCYDTAVTDVGSEFLAAQAATRQERKQTSAKTPATTTQQLGGEVCVEERWNWTAEHHPPVVHI